jgi:hypothetical protein
MKFLAILLSLFWAQPSAALPSLPRGVIAEFADMIIANSVYRPPELDDPALYPATREFGPTVIPLASLPFESELASASRKPWSSYWFPRADRSIFDDGRGSSALEKYDLVRSTLKSAESRAAEIESSRHAPNAPRWEGLCDAWAIASLLFPEPARDRVLRLDGGLHNFSNKRVTFTVGEQKALLLKTLEAVPEEALRIYGQKFTGDFGGWIYPDLFPQELHRFVEKQLFERREPFVMDHDPGVEVWSEPVFKGNYTMRLVPGRTDKVFVRLWLYSAAPLRSEDRDVPGTREVVREYNYYLYGKPDGAGNLVVTSGVWVKGDLVDSRRDHPDYVFTIPDPSLVKRESYNKEVEAEIVDQILGM